MKFKTELRWAVVSPAGLCAAYFDKQSAKDALRYFNGFGQANRIARVRIAEVPAKRKSRSKK